MNHLGFSHVNLATTDLDGTRAFYEDVLGFPVVAAGIYKIEEGGCFRHAYFDTGSGQLLSFIEPSDISGLPRDFETAINPALDVPDVFYHFPSRPAVWKRWQPDGRSCCRMRWR